MLSVSLNKTFLSLFLLQGFSQDDALTDVLFDDLFFQGFSEDDGLTMKGFSNRECYFKDGVRKIGIV